MTERALVITRKPGVKTEKPVSHTRKSEKSSSKTRAMGHSHSMSSPVDQVLYLQRMIGNQALQSLIRSGALQAKLKIGHPGDKYEQQADRVADAVMRMPEPTAVSSGELHIQKACSTCEEGELKRQPIEEEEEKLQMQPMEEETLMTKRDISPEIAFDLESSIQALRGGGQPLSKSERTFFEPRFSHDFGKVRVHSGPQASKSARAVNARAFTIGQDVVFGSGQYAPETQDGKKLLAHELTHVIQQHGGMSETRVQRSISESINGVNITKASGVNDTNLKSVATDTMNDVISGTMGGVTLDSIYVSSVNDGTHGSSSRHYSNLAVDMSRVKTAGATIWQYMSSDYPSNDNVKKVVEALQNGFEGKVGTPGVRENFGPYIKKKNGANWTVGGHGDHIHVSFNE